MLNLSHESFYKRCQSNPITIITILTIAVLSTACNNTTTIDQPITLESMRNTLENTGDYEIFDYYIPASHDYPLAEFTTGGFSFFAKPDVGNISSSTSVMVMEFFDEHLANDYADYVAWNTEFWTIFPSGKYIIVASKPDDYIEYSEVFFLNRLLNGEPPKEKKSSQGIVGMFFMLGLGIISSSAGFFSIRRNKKLKVICTTVTTGEVTGHYKHRSGGKRPSTSYYPEFSFTANGELYKKRSAVGTPRPRFDKGQKITVKFDPKNPDDYYIEEDGISNTVFYVFFIVGIIVIIGAFFLPGLYS